MVQAIGPQQGIENENNLMPLADARGSSSLLGRVSAYAQAWCAVVRIRYKIAKFMLINSKSPLDNNQTHNFNTGITALAGRMAMVEISFANANLGSLSQVERDVDEQMRLLQGAISVKLHS